MSSPRSRFARLAMLLTTALLGQAAAKTTLNFWWSQESAEDKAFLDARIAEFEKANPDIDVRLQVLPADQYLNAVNLAFRGGNPPDVFRAGGFSAPRLEDYAALGWLLPLNNLRSNSLITRYPSNTIAEGTVIFGGKMYSVPYFRTGVNNMAFLYYNKKIFAEAGLSAPPRTWNEVRAYARKITETGKGRYFGWAMQPKSPPSTYGGYLSTVARRGFVGEPHPALDYTTGRYNAEHPGQVAAVEFLRKLNLEDKAVIPGWESLDFNTLQDTFAQGRVGMMLGFAAYAGTFSTRYNMKESDFGIAPMPTETGKYLTRLPKGPPVGWFAISARTKAPKEAYKLFDFLNSEPFSLANAQERGHAPPLRLPTATLARLNFTIPAQIAVTNTEGVLRPDPRLRSPDWVKVLANFKPPQPQLYEIHAQYINGQISNYLDAAKKYDAAWNAELDRAIAAAQKDGAKVCRELLIFPNYTATRDFGSRDYAALPKCK
ncbi:ABC transporter substrate-binding protein [Deinococcus planocerae]|uniref:ABC transporter substrate-binding protein n=1 Tax=Deinococcus planocerae TaxID=1737569 RepID=UPI000C7EC02D|nr:sugar ABC transporter substrate-binding protein [Deinococcus planocerae]